MLAFLLQAPLDAQTWKNPAESLENRVNDLVSRMTLDEKVSQLVNNSPPLPRLGISAYNWWNEALHGVARAGRATVFPQAIGLAASFDTELMYRVAGVISDEARAKHHEAMRRGWRPEYSGLTFWSPNVNLYRDPRWGRGMETYGEDPYLTGRLAVAFIRGMQGDDPKYLKTIATPKHFAVHSGPEPERHSFDAQISDTDLHESYLPHFEAAIKEGGAGSIMCAYNRVDGTPACASPELLDNILRKQWGFQGYVVSDCGAIGDIYRTHKFAANAMEAAAKALLAGTDLSCGNEYSNLAAAVHAGLIQEADVDRALKRLLRARFRLGMFDPPEMVKYAQIPYSENDSPAHRALALEAARKSIVLLKNDGRMLPLPKSIRSIAVIGPDADDSLALLGNYNGTPSQPVTIVDGIRRKLPGARVRFARGSDLAAGVPSFSVIPAEFLTLRGEYFASAKLDGQALFTRADPQIDFHWFENAPRAGLKADDFGVRWTGELRAPASGTYQLGAIGMSGFELYLDGKQIASFSSTHEAKYRSAAVTLEAGKTYALRLDYHERLHDAWIQLVWAAPRPPDAQEAVDAARDADAVVLALGLSPRLEGEEMAVDVEGFHGGDRVDLGLPRAQLELMQKIAALGKPTVLVLMNGSALAVNWARDHVPAIVEAWYPGEAGGDAVADVLCGDFNPGGRLPVTFYKSAGDLPPFTDYSMKQRTYRFFSGEPLFPFGFGLSYSSFTYGELKAAARAHVNSEVTVTATVENAGARSGGEVAQLYVTGPGGAIRSLAGFERVTLRPKERARVRFVFTPRQAGDYRISVGGEQPGFKGALHAASTGVVSGTIHVD